MAKVIKSCLGTKLLSNYMDLAVNIALEAVQTVTIDENGRKEIDIKRYARIEKVRSSRTSLEMLMIIAFLNLRFPVVQLKTHR